jgi:hypothetical protein
MTSFLIAPSKKSLLTIHTLYLSLCLMMLATQASTKTAEDYANILNQSGKQRMLTQKMSKESLLIALGHESAENQAKLRSTISLFDRTLKGLKSGNADLELPANSQPQILAQLAVVEQLWAKLKPTVEAISIGTVTDSDLK